MIFILEILPVFRFPFHNGHGFFHKMNLKALKQIVTINIGKSSINSLETEMLSVRSKSGLAGPLSLQNPISAYGPKLNSRRTMAFMDGKLVGYSIGRLYSTSKTIFGANAYFPQAYLPDTLTINEIAVAQSAQGYGIGLRLLRKAMHGIDTIKNIEFSVLATNLHSEMMFTKFASEIAHTITIGNCDYTEWGNYIHWDLAIGAGKLKVKSPLFHAWNYTSGLAGYYDRQNLITRIEKQLA
jgi:hypothetical protein